MSISLRTLLAAADPDCDPEFRKLIELRFADFENSRPLIERIQSVVSLPLGVPGLVDFQEELDPNLVAQYLDHQLHSREQEDFEALCLSSDVYLAELASCFSILTNSLARPAKTTPECRAALYSLVHEQGERKPIKIASIPENERALVLGEQFPGCMGENSSQSESQETDLVENIDLRNSTEEVAAQSPPPFSREQLPGSGFEKTECGEDFGEQGENTNAKSPESSGEPIVEGSAKSQPNAQIREKLDQWSKGRLRRLQFTTCTAMLVALSMLLWKNREEIQHYFDEKPAARSIAVPSHPPVFSGSGEDEFAQIRENKQERDPQNVLDFVDWDSAQNDVLYGTLEPPESVLMHADPQPRPAAVANSQFDPLPRNPNRKNPSVEFSNNENFSSIPESVPARSSVPIPISYSEPHSRIHGGSSSGSPVSGSENPSRIAVGNPPFPGNERVRGKGQNAAISPKTGDMIFRRPAPLPDAPEPILPTRFNGNANP